MTALRRHARTILVLGLLACSPAPAAAPVPTTTPPEATPKPKPLDTSPVPEPAGLVLLGRAKLDALTSLVARSTHLPLPPGAEAVSALTTAAVGEVFDLSQPLDAAVALSPTTKPDDALAGVDALIAVSIPIKNYEQAKMKLGAKHELVIAGDNGQLKVRGVAIPALRRWAHPIDAADPSKRRVDGEGEGCVLVPATQGGRLVCGEDVAIAALAPYLSRTVPRAVSSSDLHVELWPQVGKKPLDAFRSGPLGYILGSQRGLDRERIEASLDEVADILVDTRRFTIDAQVADAGLAVTSRFELDSKQSLVARMITSDRSGPVPDAFLHLPADADVAVFGNGSDPKLFDHPREIVGKTLLAMLADTNVPAPEQGMLKDLFVERLLKLSADGPMVYAKGFDPAAIIQAETTIGTSATPGDAAERRRLLNEQVVGWHLVHVNEPIATVAPMFKDGSAIWSRPTFVKAIASDKWFPRARIAPLPAGIALPKETVHLEVVSAMTDIEAPAKVAGPQAPRKPGAPKIPRKPYVAHFFAVPDKGGTWIGFGFDAKLVAKKAAESLASAPSTNTLGTTEAARAAFREGRLNGGGILTARGYMIVAALDGRAAESPSWFLNAVSASSGKGSAPITFATRAEPTTSSAPAGGSTAQIMIAPGVLDDIAKLAFSAP